MSEPAILPILPRLSDEHLSFLVENVRDWQYQHGSLLKYPPRSGTIGSRPIGATLFPSNFPNRCYEEACALQPIFNKLYAAVAEDDAWLHEALETLIDSPNSMARILWEIHIAIKDEGYVQPLSLGIFRSDYMLHDSGNGDNAVGRAAPLEIKQVEFNTYSVAGGAHGNRISDMHKYLHKIGAFGLDPSTSCISLPTNTTVQSLTDGLSTAHAAYGSKKSDRATSTAVLMVVQPNNINICDERPIEEALCKQGVPSYRVEFGDGVLVSTNLTDTRELLYNPTTSYTNHQVEISVVFHRAGYDVEEYTESGLEARYQIEKSRAIKAPSLLCHLATLKVVQQRLALPNVLERFLDADAAARIRKTFMPMFPLDNTTLGRKGCEMALERTTAAKCVVKPSLEGGGHNVYRDAIPGFLQKLTRSRWRDLIIMEMIESPHVHNLLLTSDGLYSGPVISELGVFGACLWRTASTGDLELLSNCQAGTSLKTKRADINEISVVKGYGCFDSPCLI